VRIVGVPASAVKTVPGAPTIGTATDVGTGRAYNNGAATVTFTAPTNTGKFPITSYTVTSSPGGFTGTGASSPITVAGLASATAYTFTVTATNAKGTSAASSASNSITATTVPQAPTIGVATDGGTGSTVSVAFTAGATGGKTVTTYTATSSPGGFTGTGASSPITVSGLTTGTAYTFTVTATNANGTSAASSASNSVTPATPTSFESIATITAASWNNATFSNIPQTYKTLQLRVCVLGGGSSSDVSFKINSVGASIYNHNLSGNGTSASAGSLSWSENFIAINATNSTYPAVGIVDIIDYASTTNNKVVRSIGGYDRNGSGEIQVRSSYTPTTSAVTSITMVTSAFNSSFVSIALYGIKG
jgi:hypothetical protein